jgi:hypothetical protein
LEDNLIITPPSGYEISRDNNSWVQTAISIPPDDMYGTLASKTIYVRLASGGTAGTTPGGSIMCESTGADPQSVTVSGKVEPPFFMDVSASSISGLFYWHNAGPSEPKTFTVTGACPSDGNIIIQASGNFEVSENGISYSGTITYSSKAGGPVYVRLKSGLSVENYSGSITVSNDNDEKTVSATGRVYPDPCDGRFDYENWYAVNSFRACAIDPCYSIYRLEMNLGNDAHILISEDGSPVQLNIGAGVGLRFDSGGDGRAAYRNSAGAGSFTYYLNTTTTPYTITKDPPPPSATPIVRILGKRVITSCETITLSSVICPDDDNITYTYQWYKGNTPIGVADGGRDKTLTITPDDGDRYRLEVSSGAGTFVSNTFIIQSALGSLGAITIAATGVTNFRLNEYEHEIPFGESFTISVSALVPSLPAHEYIVQYRSLEVGSAWRDTTVVLTRAGNNFTCSFKPLIGAEYRVKAHKNGCEEYVSNALLVRVRYECKSNAASADLFVEDFGYFENNGYTYIYRDLAGNTHSTPTTQNLDYFTSDPNNSVKNHAYAGACTGECSQGWCNGRRVSDGYYAILSNPLLADCYRGSGNPFNNGDFWDGKDHTGNVNGGMLFVNVDNGPTAKGIVVYEREIEIKGDCDDAMVIFSAYISNACKKKRPEFVTIRDGAVNVRLDILRKSDGSVVRSISSGDVIIRNQGDPNMWANLSFRFPAKKGDEYILQLTNNADGGSGNDILLDDISVKLCFPSVELVAGADKVKEIVSCNGYALTTLYASFEDDDITTYFPNPRYLFQYKNKNTGGNWVDIPGYGTDVNDLVTGIITIDSLNLELTPAWEGETKVRLVVAGTEASIDNIRDLAYIKPSDSCDDLYAVDSTFVINFEFFIPEPIRDILCPGDPYTKLEKIIPAAILDKVNQWELYEFGAASPISGMTGTTKGELLSKYEQFMQNAVIDGTEKEYFLNFETSDGCKFDGKSKNTLSDNSHNDSISIILIRSPKTDVSGEAEGMSLEDFLADNNDLIKICDTGNTGSNGVQIDVVAAFGANEVPRPYKWLWILKETGDTLKRDPAPHLGPGSLLLNRSIVQSLSSTSSIFAGTIIVKTDCECTEELEIPFKIYKDFNMDLTTNVTGGKLCLPPDCGNNIVILTATLTPAITDPVKYYWYKIAPDGNEFDLITPNDGNDDNIQEVTISVNGSYRYRVAATDGVCYSSTTDASANNSDDDAFVAGPPLTLEIDGVANVCVGEDLTLTARITSVPLRGDEDSYIYTWEKTGGGTGNGSTGNEYKIENITGAGTVKVTVHDNICNMDITHGPLDYDVTTNLGTPSIQGFTVCEGTDFVTLDATTDGATYYKWYDFTTGNLVDEGKSGDGHNKYKVTVSSLAPGDYEYKAVLTGCTSAESDEATATVTVKEPLKILSLDPGNINFCSASNVNPVVFTATSNAEGSVDYIWELLGSDGTTVVPGSTETGTSSITKDLPFGIGYVKVSIHDDLCNADPFEKVKYDIQKGITIKLLAKDEDGNPISDNEQICKKKAILHVQILNGDPADYTWTWSYREPGDDYATEKAVDLNSDMTKYWVTAEKDGACTPSDTIRLGNANFINVGITGDGIYQDGGKKYKIVCLNEKFDLTATADIALPPNGFEWQLPVSPGNPVIKDNPITYLANQPGNEVIVVEAATANGACVNSDTLYLTVQEPSKIKLSTNDGIYDICQEGAYKEITLEVTITSGNRKPDRIGWNNEAEIAVSFTGNKITKKVQVSGEQTYKVYVTDDVCGRSNTDSIKITVTQKPVMELIADPEIVEVGESVKLTAILHPSGNSGEPYFWWNDEDKNWNPETTSNIILAYLCENEGIITFVVQTDVGSCTARDSVLVEVSEPIPNIITPYDANGLNDVFMEGYKVEIYNRYQQVVFRGNNGWNGSYRGQLAEPGTYFYRVYMRSGRVYRGTVDVVKF